MADSEDLDARVVAALTYYRALIESGKHTPGAEARRALLGVKQTIEDADMRRRAQPWH